jgi:hypothetical protein
MRDFRRLLRVDSTHRNPEVIQEVCAVTEHHAQRRGRHARSTSISPSGTARRLVCSPVAGGRTREVGMAVSLLGPTSLGTSQNGQQNKTQTSSNREHELHHVFSPVRSY